jgi:hypothetical protein
LSTLKLNHTFLNPFLDYERTREEASEEHEDEKIYYEEPDLSGGTDYGIVFKAKDEDLEEE